MDFCCICMNESTSQSFLIPCFHHYCITCIISWADVSRTCPLCQRHFDSVIYNVINEICYEKFNFDKPKEKILDEILKKKKTWFSTQENSSNLLFQEKLKNRKRCEKILKRRLIYKLNLWATEIPISSNSKFRMFDNKSFQKYRYEKEIIRPWLERELIALLNIKNLNFVLDLIVNLLKNIDIVSEQFQLELSVFLGSNTTHFIHEFLNFLKSPFDITTYDRHVHYQPHFLIKDDSDTSES